MPSSGVCIGTTKLKPIESKRIVLDRKIVLRFPNFDGFATEYATNLSMTGMFVRTKDPQAPGTPLAFELRLEDGAPLVRGSGWVVWARNTRESAVRPAGMGIEFTELDRQSRRLVRWMILHQLPEGQSEFDVHAGTANAPVTVEVLSAAALRRRRRAGMLTALALFGLLAGLILWRGLGSAPAERAGTRPADPATAVVETADTEEFEPSPPGPASPPDSTPASPPVAAGVRAGAAEKSVPRETEIAEEVQALVRAWARAWSEQNVEEYLDFYVAGFRPETEMSHAEWRALRRRRLTAPTSIRVGVARLEVTVRSEREARVSFLQTYRSDGFADTVDKVLELTRENGADGDGGWRIRRELAD